MIARHEGREHNDIWSALAAPLPPQVIQWRQDGRPVARDGRHTARFVAFIDAQFVRERFDTVVPGEWDLSLEMLPARATFDGEEEREPYAFKARLNVLGVMRESVGQGKDYKTAETDAFKRAAVRFGVGAELYAFGPNWVPMDGDGKYAKPIEDPSVVYAKRSGGQAAARPTSERSSPVSTPPAPTASTPAPTSSNGAESAAGDEQSCPKCGGRTWDNRLTKRNPKAPDYKCRDRNCDGVIWPPKKGATVPANDGDDDADGYGGGHDDDPLPF